MLIVLWLSAFLYFIEDGGTVFEIVYTDNNETHEVEIYIQYILV